MPSPFRPIVLVALWLSLAAGIPAQDPPKPPVKVEEPAKPRPPDQPAKGDIIVPPKLEFKDEIKPLPPAAIPDDPPPHEGAFFDLPTTIEPPDIIIVEVLEAMAGRPITGERLVRPDGTISLGFYGDLHVRGLTTRQVKEKVVLHLRQFLEDEVLGLLKFDGDFEVEVEIMPEEAIPSPKPARIPFEADKKPEAVPPSGAKPEPEPKSADPKEARRASRLSRGGRPASRRLRRGVPISSQAPSNPERGQNQEPKPEQPIVAVEPPAVEGKWTVIPPADSSRIFVDIVAHNSKVYYVQGDVGVPGRLPFTGRETVLDALNYAGGFVPTAEPADIHLYRPARGGKPAKDYKIDFDAIHKGVVTANLQVFPGDRLVVGRNPIVKKTIELDRAALPINSLFNSILSYSFANRTVGATNSTPMSGPDAAQVKVGGQNIALPMADPALTPAQRDALVKQWFEFFWSISSKDGGAMLDEKAFREALMKKLTPSPEPK